MTRNLHDLEFSEKSYCDANKTLWMHQSVIICFSGVLTLLDASTLFTVFDNLMYEEPLISYIMTLGTALCLNFIPLIVGRFIQEYRYDGNCIKKWIIWVCAVTFFVLFAATFWLRWTTREIMFESGGGISTSAGMVLESAGTDSNSLKAISLTVLLGIMPCITSMINLALGFLSADPVRLKLTYLQKEQVRLRSELGILEAAKKELDRDWMHCLQEADQEHLDAALIEIMCFRDKIIQMSKYLLAEKLIKPEAISELLGQKDTDE